MSVDGLAAVEDDARRRGLIRVGLETEIDNVAARGLYESCGFVAGPQGARVPGLPRYVRYVKELGGAHSPSTLITSRLRRRPSNSA